MVSGFYIIFEDDNIMFVPVNAYNHVNQECITMITYMKTFSHFTVFEAYINLFSNRATVLCP